MSKNLLKTGKFNESVQNYPINSKEDLFEKIKTHFETATVFALFKDKSIFGEVKNGIMSFREPVAVDIKMIEEMRIFNKKKELYLFRKNNELLGRLREDCKTGDGKEMEYVCSTIALWGTEATETDNNWTTLSEDRGIKFTIPFPLKNCKKSTNIARSFLLSLIHI
eukprot:TRINITY_DN58769_c0_g1_i1.p1 TRINITY_DN58769_c0_g1~~TRINITY_DN58769_c0_g1_i1.p1  ORF type:complete len:166 (-),score=40.14 TRINITY_DN58769_c0_g1_i1:118-615(-)